MHDRVIILEQPRETVRAMSSAHSSHQTVKSLYEAFPYPALGWVGFDPHRRAMINYHSARCCRLPLASGCRILVAGCGTTEALQWALSFPDSEVIGIDLSKSSIEMTRQRARKLGIGNLNVRELDILDASSLPGDPFDLISSYGVLHHMEDSAAGLAALKGVLAPGGLLHLMVYNTSNRYWLQAIQSMVTDLCRNPTDIGERFEVARRLVEDLARHGGHRLQGVAQEALKTLSQSEAHFMDAYAHPQEQSFTIETLMAWLASAGLRFTGWINPWQWNPRRVVNDPGLLERLERMPGERRDHFVDQTRHPLFEFYAESVEHPRRVRPCDEDEAMFWQRVPLPLAFGGHEVENGQLTGHKGICRPERELIDGEGPDGARNPTARVWVDPAYDTFGHPIMLGILDSVDGQRTMQELAQAACAAEGIAFEDVRAALRQMFRGFLDEAHCIDVDPEQCHACRRHCGQE